MSNLDHAETILVEAGYEVQAHTEHSKLYFEDHSVLGFVILYKSVAALLEMWENEQNSFLEAKAFVLRSAAQKAWNCYTVHLTEGTPTPLECQKLFDVEDNFTATRKIARSGVTTEADVRHALYPLIPIQNAVLMQAGSKEGDISQRLHDWPDPAVKALLGTGTVQDIVGLLLESE